MPAEQLKMFMTAHEIKSEFPPRTGDLYKVPGGNPSGDPEVMYSQKLKEAQANGLAASIAKSGVDTPVALLHPSSDFAGTHGRRSVYDGHHRVAAAALHPTQFLPVIHHDSTRSAQGHANRNEDAKEDHAGSVGSYSYLGSS